ncbi:MAG TPA: TonB family protein [Blastocatellia bacterium]|nr:TonB family protein [Blastocatellia bacterium]
MKTATRADAPPFSLIEQKSLPARLAEELARASREFTRDPRGFFRGLFADDTKDAKRRRRIYFGLAGALVVHAVLLTVIAVIGWRSLSAPDEGGVIVRRIDLPTPITEKSPETKTEAPSGDNGHGGRGGVEHAAPVTRGTPPPTSPAPQIVKPFAAPAEHASLPVLPTIKGPESEPPTASQVPGLPNGATDAPPAPGNGKGDGIGGHDGPGAGTADGPGGGRSKGASNDPKGRTNGTPEGTGAPSDVLYTGAKPAGFAPFTWKRRATPIVTPEAQEHRAAGRVLLRATFNANGTITDIEVVNQVEFMTESAVEALRRSTFVPASVNGVPVTVRRVPVYIDVHY